jgi:ESCRT-I complex subunit VPS28
LEALADLFAIFRATERLERAYVRDAVTAGDYERACERLIAQFRTLWGSMRASGGGGGAGVSASAVPAYGGEAGGGAGAGSGGSVTGQSNNPNAPFSIEAFMQQYHLQCPMAYNRLVQVGLPATIEHRKAPRPGGGGAGGGAGGGSGNGGGAAGARAVAEAVQHFITAMDSLKLNMVAVDQVCPLLSDLVGSLSRVGSLPPDFAPKTKAKEWYGKLYRQPASYELTEQEARQLLFDLESGYNEFIAGV